MNRSQVVPCFLIMSLFCNAYSETIRSSNCACVWLLIYGATRHRPIYFKIARRLTFRQNCGNIEHNLQQCSVYVDTGNTHKTKRLIKQRIFAQLVGYCLSDKAKCWGEICSPYKTLSKFVHEHAHIHKHAGIFTLYVLKTSSPSGHAEDPPRHFKHFVHRGAECEIQNEHFAAACCLRDAIRLSWDFGGWGLILSVCVWAVSFHVGGSGFIFLLG